MNIVAAYPPNIAQIEEVFPHVRSMKGVMFTYGSSIYVPGGGDVTPELRAHEGVHYSRQTNDTVKIEAWWAKYLRELDFRLNEEVLAHRAEFKQFCSTHPDRNARTRMLWRIAGRLAGPLYGGMISDSNARRLVAQ